MFDLNLLPMNLVHGRNVGELPGLRVYTAAKKTEKTRAADVMILLLHVDNSTPTAKELESWGRTISEAYYSARGSFTMGISAAGKRFAEYLQKQYPDDSRPEVSMNLAILRERTMLIGHAGPVNTTVILSDHVENFSDESSEPISTSASGLRFFQVEVHSGDLMLMCPKVPNGWTNDAILDATSESPLNVIRYLLNQANGNLQSAVVQIKAGRGEITYRYKPPIVADIQPEFANNIERPIDQPRRSSAVITPGIRTKARLIAEVGEQQQTDSQMLFRAKTPREVFPEITEPKEISTIKTTQTGSEPAVETSKAVEPPSSNHQNDDKQTSNPTVTADRYEKETQSSDAEQSSDLTTEETNSQRHSDNNVNNSEKIETTATPDSESGISETETDKIPSSTRERVALAREEKKKTGSTPKRNWKHFILITLCGLMIPAIVVSILFMVYSGRSKNKLHRQYLSQAVDTAQTAIEQKEPLLQDAAWDKTLEYLDEAANYGDSPAARDLRAQTLSALDDLGKGKKSIYKYGLSSPLPRGTRIVDVLSSDQYTYALDSGTGSILRFINGGNGLVRDDKFSCTPGAYYTKAYLKELRDAGKDVRFDADITKKINVGSLVGFVLLPSGNPQSDVLAAVDDHANVLYCSAYTDNSALQLNLPAKGLLGIDSVFFMENNLYLLDAHSSSLWVYDYSNTTGFSFEPASYFGSSAPNLTDVVDFVAYESYTYFLRENGTLAVCDFTGYQPVCQNVTEIKNSSGDVRIDLTRRNITHLMINRSPDNSLYLMDEKLQTVINLSVKLNFVRYITPDREKSDKPFQKEATAFGINAANKLIWAYNGDIYLGNMP